MEVPVRLLVVCLCTATALRDVTLERDCRNVNSNTDAVVRHAAGLLLSTSEAFKHPPNDYNLSVYLSRFLNDVGLYLTFLLKNRPRLFICSG